MENETLRPNVIIDGEPDTISITTSATWYTRLWRVVSNPFYYVFCGKLRY